MYKNGIWSHNYCVTIFLFLFFLSFYWSFSQVFFKQFFGHIFLENYNVIVKFINSILFKGIDLRYLSYKKLTPHLIIISWNFKCEYAFLIWGAKSFFNFVDMPPHCLCLLQAMRPISLCIIFAIIPFLQFGFLPSYITFCVCVSLYIETRRHVPKPLFLSLLTNAARSNLKTLAQIKITLKKNNTNSVFFFFSSLLYRDGLLKCCQNYFSYLIIRKKLKKLGDLA